MYGLACVADAESQTEGTSGATSPSSSTGSESVSGSSTGAWFEDVVPGERAALVDVAAWVKTEPDDDRFGPVPADASCELGFGEEDGLFEVDTELCNWGTFEQPSLVSVRAGDQLELVMVHDALYSEEAGATAVLGLSLGEDIVWTTEIPIPSEAGFLRPIIVAPADAPAGTPVRFHVHNHGVNSYRFVELDVIWVP